MRCWRFAVASTCVKIRILRVTFVFFQNCVICFWNVRRKSFDSRAMIAWPAEDCRATVHRLVWSISQFDWNVEKMLFDSQGLIAQLFDNCRATGLHFFDFFVIWWETLKKVVWYLGDDRVSVLRLSRDCLSNIDLYEILILSAETLQKRHLTVRYWSLDYPDNCRVPMFQKFVWSNFAYILYSYIARVYVHLLVSIVTIHELSFEFVLCCHLAMQGLFSSVYHAINC